MTKVTALIGVVILSPNLLLRMGLREMLRAIAGVVVTGEASSLHELGEIEAEAEVIVMASASESWFEPNSFLLSQQAILLLSDEPALVNALIARGGLWGVLPPDPSQEELSASLQAMHRGLAVLPAHLASQIWRDTNRANHLMREKLADPLTPREIEILGLIAQGLANKQIAGQLRISEHTVKFHLSSLYAKLGANSRTEAVRVGMLQGLIGI
jgi:DNA-binding NarL/FixJ family response regulator